MIRAVGSVRVVDSEFESGKHHEHWQQFWGTKEDSVLRHIDFETF